MGGPSATGNTDDHDDERRRRPRVLLVEPDPAARAALAAALGEAGCEVLACLRSGIGAAYAVRTQQPTVVVTELAVRPGGAWSGLLLLASLAKDSPAVRVLVVTGPERAHLAGRAVAAGARRMLPKSDLAALVAAVHEEHAAHVQAAYPFGGAGAGGARRRG